MIDIDFLLKKSVSVKRNHIYLYDTGVFLRFVKSSLIDSFTSSGYQIIFPDYVESSGQSLLMSSIFGASLIVLDLRVVLDSDVDLVDFLNIITTAVSSSLTSNKFFLYVDQNLPKYKTCDSDVLGGLNSSFISISECKAAKSTYRSVFDFLAGVEISNGLLDSTFTLSDSNFKIVEDWVSKSSITLDLLVNMLSTYFIMSTDGGDNDSEALTKLMGVDVNDDWLELHKLVHSYLSDFSEYGAMQILRYFDEALNGGGVAKFLISKFYSVIKDLTLANCGDIKDPPHGMSAFRFNALCGFKGIRKLLMIKVNLCCIKHEGSINHNLLVGVAELLRDLKPKVR